MSLFKSRQFWSAGCDDGEDFGNSSLKVSKLNSEVDFILTGSHSGILRIFKPSTIVNENNVLSEYKPSDLFIEKNLNFPILQVDVGRLVSGSPYVQIAILHPRSFAVYSFTSKEGVTEQGNQNMINLLYEHKLRRSTANFAVGPFGGSQKRDFIAVQSLDGMLSLFEQETFVFCCFLPNFLLPGPFIYSSRIDSFVISGSNLNIESYSYKTLSTAGQNTEENDVSGLKFEPDWSFNLSETVLDLQYSYDGFSKESFLLVLGERNFYCLTDNGKLKFMKRLDYTPCCFTTYYLGENKLMCLIVSDTGTLLVYQNTTLRWSAQLSSIPIAISRANFKTLRGVLVTLSDEGNLQCSYLGTEPSLFSAPPLYNQEINFEQAEQELNTLNKIIRSTYNNDLKLSNKTADRELSVTITINPHLETCVYDHSLQEEDAKMCSVRVSITPQAVFEELNVSVNVRMPLKAAPQAEFFQNLSDKTSFDFYVYACEESDIPSLDLDVIVTCISNIGMPRVIRKTASIPMNLVMKTHPPIKESLHKIILNSNENSVPLSTLFPEYIGENSLTVNSNAVCFTNISNIGSPVTILLAKSSQRYRLQSDSITSLNICVQELTRRLRHYYASNTSFKVSYSSALPTTQVVQLINEHHETRRKVLFLQNELIQLGAQFRMIQKRLISKFKDKNPTPLTNLDMLLSDTYKQTVDISTHLENSNKDLLKSQINLACGLELIIHLIDMSDSVSSNISILKNALSSYIYDIEGQNWEDTLDASLNYLLRTVLAKSEKDKMRASQTSYEEVKDLSKIDKHLSSVLARIGNIADVPMNEDLEEEATLEKEEVYKDPLPLGSRLGESSSRALSARKSLLRRRQPVQIDE